MWCPLFFLLLIGAVSGRHFQTWKTDTQYEYHVESRTLTALHDFSNQYTGLIVRGLLTIRPKSEDILQAKFSDVRAAEIDAKFPSNWTEEIPDSILQSPTVQFERMLMLEKIFEIKVQGSVIRDLLVDKDVPTWEINVLKSIVGQLHVGVPTEEITHTYKTFEDSVGGNCEVRYNGYIFPNERFSSNRPYLIIKPELRGSGAIIEIDKHKDYCKCRERMNYHHGTTKWQYWDPCKKDNGKSLKQSSVSRVVLTGDLKTCTIQSSLMIHQVILSPNLHENKKGMVGSMVNVTLVKMEPVSPKTWATQTVLESVGNLVYSYDNPFLGTSANRGTGNMDTKPISIHDGFNASWSANDEHTFQRNQNQSQPIYSLNEPPMSPLLPFLVDDVMHTGHLGLVEKSKKFAEQIGHELEHPNSITDKQTLDKFTILVTLIRAMNTKQISQAQWSIHENEMNATEFELEIRQRIKQNSWAAFRDAVAQAGTGPALITIKKWIKDRTIEGVEAALVVAVLSKTARETSPEYVNAFFEMVIMPETINQEFLNATAMVIFGELIRYTQVNFDNVIHQRFTSFGRSSPKQNPAIVRYYMPYMAEQLKESIEKNEFTRSHVFIRALGNTAHPKILTVFEPYLNGEVHATIFQRLLMIFSLNYLAALKPDHVRGTFFKVYYNTTESHQLRSAAAAFLISTNPPTRMLRQMAEFTHYDHSRQVNAAVKSAIQSASKLVTPESQLLATKARIVLSLLTDESYDNEDTNSFFSDYESSHLNLGYRMQTYLDTDEMATDLLGLTKLAFYGSVQARYGDFEVPKSEIAALVSGLNKIGSLKWKDVNTDYSDTSEDNENMEYTLKKIAKMLKMKTEDNENLEAVFWANNEYENQFLSFDKHSLQRIPDFLRKAGERFMEEHNFNMVKIESYDTTLSLPMESGFPFIYTRKVPTMLKLTGSGKGDQSLNFINGTIAIRLVTAMQIQGRLGFISPFKHYHYMAGVNKNLQVHVPIRIQAGFDKNEKRITVKFEPIEQNETCKLAHYSLVPFTSLDYIRNESPIILNPRTRKLINGKISHRATSLKNLKFQMETASPFTGSMDRSNWDPVARSIFTLAEDNPEYGKTEVYFEPDESGEQSVILTASFNFNFNETIPYNETRSKASPKATAPVVKSKKLYDSERGKQLMQKAAEGISYSVAYSLDLGIEIPGEEPSQMLMTAAYATSLIDEKSRGLVYWRVVDPQWLIEFETCAGLEFQTPRMDTIKIGDKYFYKDNEVYRNFDVDLQFGVTCKDGYNIQMQGKQVQSNEYKKSVRDMPILSVCMKDVAAGGVSTPACKDAGNKIYAMDKTNILIKFNEKFTDFEEEVPKYFTIINSIPCLKSYIFLTVKDKPIADNTLLFKMTVEPTRNSGSISLEDSIRRLLILDQKIPHGILIANLHHDLSDVSERIFMNLIDDNPREETCEFEYSKATTFDNVTYPIEFGGCWHVATTNYPKKNVKYSANVPAGMALSVLIRDSNDTYNNANKDLLIITENHEVKFEFVNNETLISVDGTPIYLNETNNRFDLSQFALQRTIDDIVEFIYPIFNFVVRYNGSRVQILASEDYRNKIRGLCGNYDNEPTNDFLSPTDGALSTSQEFVAAFALNSSDCAPS